MSNVNTVSVSGNLTRDPEIRVSASGVSFLNFRIAVNENRKGGDGEWTKYANFFDAVAIGKRAEGLAKFMKKGMHVSLCGKLSWREWEATDGTKRQAVSIVVNEIDVMSVKDGGGSIGTSTPSEYADTESDAGGYDGEDIPF